MRVSSLDQVKVELERIIAGAALKQDPIGLFPSLYRQMTGRVGEAITAGRFDDGPRMGRFVVSFANRYLDAEAAWSAGQPPSRAWRVAFEATRDREHALIQHLLLGMNAHINLDLAPTVVEVLDGAAPKGIERDFMQINAVLAELLDDVQAALDRHSPWLAVLDRLGGQKDEWLGMFGLQKARDAAWRSVLRLHREAPRHRVGTIEELDRHAATLGRLLRSPGPLFGAALTVVAHGEASPLSQVFDDFAAVGR